MVETIGIPAARVLELICPPVDHGLIEVRRKTNL
jgi:hypothetical protein